MHTELVLIPKCKIMYTLSLPYVRASSAKNVLSASIIILYQN